MRELDRPFWLAGGAGSPDGLRAALAAGAAGIQVGTLFAFSNESGLDPDLKARVVGAALAGQATVFTDPRASPTDYPFKVVAIAGDDETTSCRERVCRPRLSADGGAHCRPNIVPMLRRAFGDLFANGGAAADTIDRRCLCNGLTANIGQAQSRETGQEPPLVTSGDDLLRIPEFLGDRRSYSAADVVAYLDC